MTLFDGKVTLNENYTLVPSIQHSFYMVMDDDRIRLKQFRNRTRAKFIYYEIRRDKLYAYRTITINCIVSRRQRKNVAGTHRRCPRIRSKV